MFFQFGVLRPQGSFNARQLSIFLVPYSCIFCSTLNICRFYYEMQIYSLLLHDDSHLILQVQVAGGGDEYPGHPGVPVAGRGVEGGVAVLEVKEERINIQYYLQ